MVWFFGAGSPENMYSLPSRVYRSIWQHSMGTRSCRRRHLVHLQEDTSLSLVRVPIWIPSGRISISHRLGFCAGVCSWGVLKSSLKCYLEAVSHVFPYPGLHHDASVVFDPTYPSVEMGTFIKTDWESIHGDVKETIPSDAPVLHGKEVDLRLLVDYDNADNLFTRRSRNGVFIYLNMAPIVWLSKHNPTVESSVFGAEFVAMNNGIETCCDLHYKLRMMGLTLSGPTYIYGDNMSVVHNTQRPSLS
jgi:hypothetical protein